MQSRTPSRDALLQLVSSGKITSGGKDWLTFAVDPFHDKDLPLAGYPDIETASTIVQLVKTQFTVGTPLGTAANWDANVSFMPNISGLYSPTPFDFVNGVILGSDGGQPASINTGGVVAVTGPVGFQCWPSDGTPFSSATTLGGKSVPRTYCKGLYRVIGAAFEVVNTTAEIYKQGQVTVYRQPCNAQNNSFVGFTGTPFAGDLTIQNVDTLRMPPGSLADAQLLFGSASWLAADGAYVIAMLNDVDNPLQSPSFRRIVYLSTDLSAGSQENPAYIGLLDTVGDFSQGLHADNVFPFDVSGAYFTGLSSQTTLVVNCRWLIERCPTVSESDLTVLAQPSPEYDPASLQLYSSIMRYMPPGVPQGMNPLGEWFDNIMSAVADYAGSVGDALTVFTKNPIPAVVGRALASGASVIVTARGGKKKNKSVQLPVTLGSRSTTTRARVPLTYKPVNGSVSSAVARRRRH
jgi:hypothetical protein